MAPALLEYEIDQKTADLIIQLQLEDAGIYLDCSKGKSRDPTNEKVAFQLQTEELENASEFLADKRMAISMAKAVLADGQILDDNKAHEEAAVSDRQLARNLERNEHPVTTDPVQSNYDAGDLDDETLEKLRILYISGLEEEQELQSVYSEGIDAGDGESSTWAAGQANHAQSMRRCEACREETRFINVVRVPCRHEYCRACLEALFESSMTDESLFPPRCCRVPIATSSTVRIFLKSAIIRLFEKKKIEFETPNRTYCYSLQCSTFIPQPQIKDNVATCAECGCTTCASCKARAHTGDCPNDTAMQQLLAIAQDNGWQRCSSCWRVVELNVGCNHMTCHCGHQFCYNCGERWKTCNCEQWDEHRLYERAYEIIDREPNPNLNNTAPIPTGLPTPGAAGAEVNNDRVAEFERARAALVARTVQQLRENHECEHDQWRWVRGRHQCEECYFRLPQYIFECRQCRLRACNRCRRNRL
ncbi:hypothetical protein BJX70DRAFT_408084 [Aspergillus crustosus]